MYTVQWYQIHLHSCAKTPLSISITVFILWNWSSRPMKQWLLGYFLPPSPGKHHSTFCVYDFDCCISYKESWAPKNWCFWTVLLEKTLESSLDCKEIQPVHPEGDKSWVFIGRTDFEVEYFKYSFEYFGHRCQYWGHLMRRADLFEKTLMLGKIEGRRRRGQQRMRWLDGITYSMDMGLGALGSWWWTGSPGVLQFMGSQRVRHDWGTELNWTDLKYVESYSMYLFLTGLFHLA